MAVPLLSGSFYTARSCHTAGTRRGTATLTSTASWTISVVLGVREGVGSRLEIESASEEGRHLSPGHRFVGAEAGVGGRVAAFGDACLGHCCDSALVQRAVVVGESASGAGLQ